MSEMIERLREVIRRGIDNGWAHDEIARAEIEALRAQPITYAMRVAAVNTTLPGIGEPPLYEKIWQAMLAAALSPSREDEGK